MKRLTLSLIGCLCLCGIVSAQQTPQASTQDIIFFSNSGPVMFRLMVTVDGKSLGTHLEPFLTGWFNRLDKDKNGLLNAEEVKYAPTVTSMRQMFQTGYYYPRTNTFLNLTAFPNSAKGVDSKAFVAYYDQVGLSSLQITRGATNYRTTGSSGDRLFRLLDADNNDKISGQEISSVLKRLNKLDQNEDEYLDTNELSGATNPSYPYIRTTNLGARSSTGTVPKEFFVVDSQQKRVQLLALMLAKLDKNKDLQLSQQEIPLSKRVFEQYDRNRNKKLSVDELTSWTRLNKPITLVVPLGNTRPGAGMDLAPGQKLPQKLAFSQTNKETVQFKMGDAKITVRQLSNRYAMMNTNAGRYYLQLYRTANAKSKKKFLERKELEGQNSRFRILNMLFPVADENGDDKLTEEEVQEFANFIAKARKMNLNLSISEEGRGLFQLVDANRDSKLSLRELLNAWSQLKEMDVNKDGEFTKDEVSRQFTMTVSQGNMAYYRTTGGGFNRPLQVGNPINRTSTNAPTWFRKMDVNGDGDVSSREFLGSATLFNEFDTDNDTLISPTEAVAASKRFES